MRLHLPSALLLTALLLACGGSGAEPADGDGTEPIPCASLTDCPPPMLCVDLICVSPSDGDSGEDEEGQVCETSYDCPSLYICDPETHRCIVYEPEDGDEPESDDLDAPEEETPEDDPAETPESEEESDDESSVPIFINFQKPAADAVLDGTLSIQVDIGTSLTIDRVDFIVGSQILSTLTAAPWQVEWDTAASAEGPVELSVVAYSGAQFSSARRTVTVDHSVPTLEIVAPASGALVGNRTPPEIVLNVGDHLQSVKVLLDGNDWLEITEFGEDAETRIPYDPVPFGPGEHLIEVVVRDLVEGHSLTQSTVAVVFDNLYPTLSISNVLWFDENPDEGEIFAETPVLITMDDDSLFESAHLEFWDDFNHQMLTVDQTGSFSHEVTRFDDLLPEGFKSYPVRISVIANATDAFGNFKLFNKVVTVKRRQWSYDPALSVPSDYEHKTGASASAAGNLYASLYTKVVSLSSEGTLRWDCPSPGPILTTPVVAEQTGFPEVVLNATNDGTLLVRTENGDESRCEQFKPMEGVFAPSEPAPDQFTATTDGFELTFFFCAATRANEDNEDDTRCMKIRYAFNTAASEGVLSTDWDRSYLSAGPPTALAVPQGGALNKICLAMGNKIQLLDKSNGTPGAFETFNPGQKITHLSVNARSTNTLAEGVYAQSVKEFHYFSQTLTRRGGIMYSTDESVVDAFAPTQPITFSNGMFLLSTQLTRQSLTKGVLMALDVDHPSANEWVYPQRWEFVLPKGLIGGTPAVGMDQMIYLPGAHVDGYIWALKETTARSTSVDLVWSVALGTPILAPLLITPWGDLIAVGKNLVIYSIDARGDTNDATQSWPMFQSNPGRQGGYTPRN